MCKGISIVATKADCYWSPDNSHETIKKENNIRDTMNHELLIIELYPRGDKFLSEHINDWELTTENTPNWYAADKEEINSRIYNYLFGSIFPRAMLAGIDVLRLDGLGLGKLPDFGVVKIKYLYCPYNQITSLIVPEGIETLYCSNNQITSLTVPEGIKNLYCSYNQITSLTVPEGIKILYCSYNQITSLTVPEGIETLVCYGNQITSLTVPEGIETLVCYGNHKDFKVFTK